MILIPTGFVNPPAVIPIDVHPVSGVSPSGGCCRHVPCCYCVREGAAS